MALVPPEAHITLGPATPLLAAEGAPRVPALAVFWLAAPTPALPEAPAVPGVLLAAATDPAAFPGIAAFIGSLACMALLAAFIAGAVGCTFAAGVCVAGAGITAPDAFGPGSADTCMAWLEASLEQPINQPPANAEAGTKQKPRRVKRRARY